MKKWMALLAGLGCVGITGCKGHDSSNAPPSGQIATVNGTYVGTFNATGVTNADITMVLNQSGANVTGTETAVNGAVQGTVAGTVGTNSFVFTITQTQPCSGSYTGQAAVDGSTLSGTVTGSNCNGSISGTFTAVKQ